MLDTNNPLDKLFNLAGCLPVGVIFFSTLVLGSSGQLPFSTN